MRPFSFTLRPPRHPLLRAALALTGLFLLGFFAMFGLAIAAVVLIGFGVRRLLQPRADVQSVSQQKARRADPGVIEGEYSVVRKSQAGLSPR
jgi:hypothetical protein